MCKISTYDRAILLVTIVFVLIAGGWFLREQKLEQVYSISPSNRVIQKEPMEASEQTEITSVDSDCLLPENSLDLNMASVVELECLPGIGEKRALEIVAYREQVGQFQCIEELMEVPGIGEKRLEELRPYLYIKPRTVVIVKQEN